MKLRDKAEERFQSFFEREIHQLHNSVQNEAEVSVIQFCSSFSLLIDSIDLLYLLFIFNPLNLQSRSLVIFSFVIP
jgi:heptaprenylglyceryl phosphate synthase